MKQTPPGCKPLKRRLLCRLPLWPGRQPPFACHPRGLQPAERIVITAL
jgi:hypothetical protein